MSVEIGSKTWNNEMYEKHATPYNGIAGFIQRKRLEKIAKYIQKFNQKKVNTVLEIGCEEGNLLNYLSSKFVGWKFFGCDISSKAIAEGKKWLPSSIELSEHDITTGPFVNDQELDFIVCSETLEHIPDAVAAINGIYNSTGENSTVIITVPIERYKNNIKKWLVRLGIFNLFFKGIEESLSEWHVQDFSKEEILNLLKPYFEVVAYDTIWWMHQLIVLKRKNNG